MKKSELRAIIREMLHEELEKMNNVNLTESAVAELQRQDSPAVGAPVEAGSVLDTAYDIFNSPEFAEALAIDGGVMGDSCMHVIDNAIVDYWPTANTHQFNRTRDRLEVLLSRILNDEGVANTYNTKSDPDIQRIMKHYNPSEDDYN